MGRVQKDAREEITKFVEEINNVGDGFTSTQFCLKSCLVISDFGDIAFKVYLNKSNMLKIESNRDTISKAIRLAVELVEN